jgi:hypothetical protein
LSVSIYIPQRAPNVEIIDFSSSFSPRRTAAKIMVSIGLTSKISTDFPTGSIVNPDSSSAFRATASSKLITKTTAVFIEKPDICNDTFLTLDNVKNITKFAMPTNNRQS